MSDRHDTASVRYDGNVKQVGIVRVRPGDAVFVCDLLPEQTIQNVPDKRCRVAVVPGHESGSLFWFQFIWNGLAQKRRCLAWPRAILAETSPRA